MEENKAKRPLLYFAGKWKFLDKKEIKLIKDTIRKSEELRVEKY